MQEDLRSRIVELLLTDSSLTKHELANSYLELSEEVVFPHLLIPTTTLSIIPIPPAIV